MKTPINKEIVINILEATGRYIYLSGDEDLIFDDSLRHQKIVVNPEEGLLNILQTIALREINNTQDRKPIISRNNKVLENMKTLFERFCEVCGVTADELQSNRKHRLLTDLRKVWCKIAFEFIPQSQYDTVGYFINKHYSTVIYNLNSDTKEIEHLREEILTKLLA